MKKNTLKKKLIQFKSIMLRYLITLTRLRINSKRFLRVRNLKFPFPYTVFTCIGTIVITFSSALPSSSSVCSSSGGTPVAECVSVNKLARYFVSSFSHPHRHPRRRSQTSLFQNFPHNYRTRPSSFCCLTLHQWGPDILGTLILTCSRAPRSHRQGRDGRCLSLPSNNLSRSK